MSDLEAAPEAPPQASEKMDGAIPELGVPDRLPRNIMELPHRRIVNPEGQPLIVWNGQVYWYGSGRLIGPVAILKPTCPREYYFCDYCGGTFTQKFSNVDHEESLSKHFERDHRDVVLRSMPQPRGTSFGSWTPSTESVHMAAEKLAGVVPEKDRTPPQLIVKPIESLAAANKRPAKKWKESTSDKVTEE